ncbi:hypothetical protein A2159_02670 [Candidatus Woesebacteria bacterium RBG_13_34_9]|uniref:DNA helicase UvrD n=1 Tax=Candidatus Woesebacteria bacterium RBG_13_34_9 TaxID=1802477 RepID=A0A1F7X083_9BACT|nr:MAG: hypothetical protein A2159_02670 [Candidatus Woesebacteria bacterium RBG_13_34_9]
MDIIADLHLHSRYSRAVSKDMTLPKIADWTEKKGIGLAGTGDWTHPMWYREIKSQLLEVNEGVYELNSKLYKKTPTQFLLTTELSCIYSQGGKSRRIHLLVFAPKLETVEEINKNLSSRGLNLFSDGRPILGISAKNLTEIILSIDEKCLIIPAHIWTPWFSLYGSMSGFDSINECFGEFSKNIYAVETGLSSDPAMNWRVDELKEKRIVSFGDSHSPQKLGREATVFQTQNENSKNEITYQDIYEAILGKSGGKWKIGYTIEFYPEEGKYHYSGHKSCKVVYSANDVRKKGSICPVCGKTLTIGVTYRVEKLGLEDIETESIRDKFNLRYIKDKKGKRVPYVMLVPLLEILAESLELGVSSKKVLSTYDVLISRFGNEFQVLLNTATEDIKDLVGERISDAILRVRTGDVVIEPGYDGIFGTVAIWKKDIIENIVKQEIQEPLL